MACIFCKMPYVFFRTTAARQNTFIVSFENYAKQSPCKDAENELFRTFAQDI